MKVEITKVNIVSRTNFREILLADISAIVTIKEDNKIRACINLKDIEKDLKPKEYFNGSATFANFNGILLEYSNFTTIRLWDNAILRMFIYKNY